MPQEKECYFCVNGIDNIDWKKTDILKKFLTYQYKIASRKRNGLCAKHQRQIAKAIKRARVAAILPFTARRRY